MTDLRLSGLWRESLLAADGRIKLSGLYRETLLAADGYIRLSALYREVLIGTTADPSAPPVVSGRKRAAQVIG